MIKNIDKVINHTIFGVCMHEYVCMWYIMNLFMNMGIHNCGDTCTCVYIRVEVRGLCDMPFSITLYFIY